MGGDEPAGVEAERHLRITAIKFMMRRGFGESAGKVRAFHNVCTHRGNKVVPSSGHETYGRARANVVSCRFHGWVFSTEGPLRSVPMKEAFGKLDTSCLGLKPIACDRWEGFIFINMADEPEQSLSEYLGDFGRLFSGYPYAESTTAFRYTTVLECNWKIALYAFSEGYHVPTIHAGSLPGFRGVVIVMDHVSKSGAPKILERCTLPLTGAGVVDLIITDLCVLAVDPAGGPLRLIELAPGVDVETVRACTAAAVDARACGA